MTALLPDVESAFLSLLNASASVTNTFAVYAGKSNADKQPPCVVVESGDSTEDVYETGNYMVPVTIRIMYAPGTDTTSKATSNTATGAVHTILFADDLAASLSAAIDNFTCFGVVSRAMSAGREDDVWVETVDLEVLCCASDLS